MQNRWFNPPGRVPSLGRELRGIVWSDLAAQLGHDDVLIGVYRNELWGFLMATHLHSEERFDEMEKLYPAVGYYALDLQAANTGMDHVITR